MKQWNIQRLVFDALLIALTAALGEAAIEMGVFKLTFENLPIIIGALMFGPLDGFIIGVLGIFFSQLFRFGLDATMVLWILPYAISGLFVGLFSKKLAIGRISWKNLGKEAVWIVLLMIANCAMVTLINTGSLYISYKYVWFMPTAPLFASLPMKLGIGVGRAVVYAIIAPALIQGLAQAKVFRTVKSK